MDKIVKTIVYKGVDKPFEVMGLEGLFAIAAAVSLLSCFILVVVLCLLLDSKLVIIVFFTLLLVFILRTIFNLNKKSSIKELELKYNAKKIKYLCAR